MLSFYSLNMRSKAFVGSPILQVMKFGHREIKNVHVAEKLDHRFSSHAL